MNKKSIAMVGVITMVGVVSFTVGAKQRYRLMIDGRDVQTEMIVKEGTTYVPLKTITNELGMSLEFKNGTIKLTTSKKEIYIKKLQNIEEEVKHIDYGMTTLDMKEAMAKEYTMWDDALNEIYGVLKTQLSDVEMEALIKEQRQWIVKRDEAATAAAEEFKGGTMAPLQYASTLSEETRKRCLELVENYMK